MNMNHEIRKCSNAGRALRGLYTSGSFLDEIQGIKYHAGGAEWIRTRVTSAWRLMMPY
jgi:hypothetical protein